MGDIVLALLEEIAENARNWFKTYGQPLEEYPIAGGWEFGEPPEGHLQAWRAGAMPPWPAARYPGDLLEFWWQLHRSARSGRMGPRPETDHRALSDVPHCSNSGAAGLGASRWQGSANWSGAILTAREGERFTCVSGRWRVPGAKPDADAPPPIPGPEDTPPSRRCSVWVGLDGHRASFGSLPQAGTTTAEVFEDGRRTVQTYAWAQWWVKGQQYGEWVFLDFPVRPGDEVSVWVALQEPDRAVFRLRNETLGREDGVVWQSGGLAGPLIRAIHKEAAPVPGQAAVWCVERPMVMGRTDLYPLPDFGTVSFERCIAATRMADQPFHEAADLRDLSQARLVRMFDHRDGPERSRRIAVPQPRPGDRLGFEVSYRG